MPEFVAIVGAPGSGKHRLASQLKKSLGRNATVLSLTPNQSGYMFALTYFLVSTDERIEKYRQLLAKCREGSQITKELILSTYGYENDEALEADWYEFMESRDFR